MNVFVNSGKYYAANLRKEVASIRAVFESFENKIPSVWIAHAIGSPFVSYCERMQLS